LTGVVYKSQLLTPRERSISSFIQLHLFTSILENRNLKRKTPQIEMQNFIVAIAAVFAVGSVSASPLRVRQATSTAISTSELTIDLPFTAPYAQLQYFSLYYANNSAFIGQVRYESESERLIITNGGSFTSIHASPTGSQQMWVYPALTQPIGFTVPHSGLLPDDTSSVGFNFTGGLFGVNGTTSKWVACPSEFTDDGNWTIAQIFWQGGDANPSCVPVNLTQYVYGHPGA
jgi:hypothetical protein